MTLELHDYGKIKTISQALSTAAADVQFEVMPSVFNSMTNEQKKKLDSSLLYLATLALEYDLTPSQNAKAQPLNHPVIFMRKCYVRENLSAVDDFARQKRSEIPKQVWKKAIYINRVIQNLFKHREKWNEKHFLPLEYLFPAVMEKMFALRFEIEDSSLLETQLVDLTNN